MPAAKKTLGQLVHDRSFLGRRHAYLLVTGELVAEPTLRVLQAAYRAEDSELERQALARRFEKAVQARADEPALSIQQELCAAIGLGAADHADWEAWDHDFGFAWRVAHGAMHRQDEIEAFRRLHARAPAGTRAHLYAEAKRLAIPGRSRMRCAELARAIASKPEASGDVEDLRRIREAIPNIAERAKEELGLEPAAPDPPGFEFC